VNKIFKKVLIGVALLFCAGALSGCTKSFCTVNDKACLYDSYVEKNQSTIDTNATKSGYLLPSTDFWTFIDTKVENAYQEAIKDPTNQKWAPVSYVESNVKYNDAATTDTEKTTLVNDKTLKAVIRYGGYNSNNQEELWANFGTWLSEAKADATVKDGTPTAAYLAYYKSSINSGVGNAVTCITPSDGYFGAIDNQYFVEGKTWGQAFSDFGFIEGLLVYPIAWLVYQFSIAFGTTGGGQILAIFLVTLIVRAFIVVASIGSNNTQTKMADMQPQIAMLQAKYPNSETNQYEKQKLTTETMALYKKNDIHPFRQIIVLIVQFPLFIAVWGALEGSAILTSGSVFSLSLSTVTMKAMTANNSETPFAIILFIAMAIAQFFASMIPMWIQNWHKKRAVGAKTVKVNEDSTSGAMMKYMPYIMMVVVIAMGLNLPAAMGIYWFFGALISIFQSLIMEIVQEFKKGRRPKKDKPNRRGDDKHMKLR
jgi:YidC/Oxa1 family membrane protein insertase